MTSPRRQPPSRSETENQSYSSNSMWRSLQAKSVTDLGTPDSWGQEGKAMPFPRTRVKKEIGV